MTRISLRNLLFFLLAVFGLFLFLVLFGTHACSLRRDSDEQANEPVALGTATNDRSRAKLQELLVAEYLSPKAGDSTYLVSYSFIDGVFKSKDTLFKAPRYRKKSDVNRQQKVDTRS